MKLKIFIVFLITIFLYLTTTFLISFINISNYVANDNSKLLDNYVYKNVLKKNLNKNINYYIENNLDNIEFEFLIKDKNLEFSGNLSKEFVLKNFQKVSSLLSSDLTNPKIMLYFYKNSNEINIYFNKLLLNFGNYSFDEYLKENKKNNYKNKKIEKNNNEKTISEKNNINNNEILIAKIKRLLKKIKATKYFFFSSPINFKLSVIHQEIPFTVIFRFNGFYWKISDIVITYKLINS